MTHLFEIENSKTNKRFPITNIVSNKKEIRPKINDATNGKKEKRKKINIVCFEFLFLLLIFIRHINALVSLRNDFKI